MPEGDALSVYGMTQLCFTWHLYMRVYCPSVRSLSFVDNLSVVAQVTGALAHGLVCLLEFFRLWNMKIDEGKSYCWALTTEQRRQLVALPFQRVEHARELGGVMSFIAKLAAVRRRLRQSKAPLRLKLSAVPTVCWTSALHGINGSCLGEVHLDHLRTAALNALQLARAGVNGFVKLTLSTTPLADPGLWRLQMTVHSFIRLVRKEPRMFSVWRLFMCSFDGNIW